MAEASSSSHRSRADTGDRKSHRHRHDQDSRRRRSRSPDHRSSDGRHSHHHRHSSSRRHGEDYESERSHRYRSSRDKRSIIRGEKVDDDKAEEDAAQPVVPDPSTMIPSSVPLGLRSHAEPTQSEATATVPKDPATGSQLKRDHWMVSEPSRQTGSDDTDVHDDYFSSMGSQKIKKAKEDKPNPDELKVSSRELNTQFAQGKHIDEYIDQPKQRTAYGAPGYQWRMMKLRKTLEQADEEGRPIEEVAVERYGDISSFEEAKAEKDFLDRQGRKDVKGTPARPSALPSRSFMFTDSPDSSFGGGGGGRPSRPVSRQSFKRPGEASAPSTPQPEASSSALAGRLHALRGESRTPQTKPSTPVPSVFTPTVPASAEASATSSTPHVSEHIQHSDAVRAAVTAVQERDTTSNPPMDAAALNKLEAKVMKAEMTNKPNARALRQKLDREKARATNGGDQGGGHFEHASAPHPVGVSPDSSIQVLPTLDVRGRLYDVGKGSPGDDRELPPGNRRRKANKVQTHDPKTGEFVRYNADDDDVTLEEMVRQEKFQAGSRDQKNYDAELSSRIASDAAFKDGFDYLDENVERLARKKMRSDALKRQFAINDFAKTKKALESCRFCFRDEGERPPMARVVASGTRAYLALTEYEPLVEGHCLIVPIQHHLTMLEADDDTWEEVKNFMKCLLQLAASKGQGVIFFETVVSLKHQRHTVIEAMPLALDLLSSLPGTFRHELMTVESDWSQHHKVVEFSSDRPFRRAMVSQLPYFMVQFDHRGERGYGHVIEGAEAGDAFAQDDGYGISEAAMGGGKFNRWFATEIIGTLLDLEPQAWRKPPRLDQTRGTHLLDKFKNEWQPFDWTKLIGQTSSGGRGGGGRGEGEGRR